jgi:putative ABC transport system permease protein
MSPAAAARLGVPVKVVAVVALGTHAPSSHDEDRARNALAALNVPTDLQVERGYHSRYGTGLLALLLGSAIIVLGASGTATGLAAADGRADLATLAAVGAAPSTRRSLAAFQSATTAGLGTVLGVLAGLVPGVGVVLAINAAAHTSPLDGDSYPLVLPWTNVLLTLVVVPAVAALSAWALTRSRLPLVRRAT